MVAKPANEVRRKLSTGNPRTSNRLTAAAVRNAKVGRHGDGNGLSLIVTAPERKHWQFRYMRAGKGREMSLGNAAHVTLADARQRAQEAHKLLSQGVDPLDQRQASSAAHKSAPSRSFAAVAEQYIAAHEASWRNEKHKYQWRQSIASYAYPHIGSMDVAAIEMEHVRSVLQPIWTTKTETASRLRGRIETILAYSIVSKWRTGPNPATWRGNLQMVLPAAGQGCQGGTPPCTGLARDAGIHGSTETAGRSRRALPGIHDPDRGAVWRSARRAVERDRPEGSGVDAASGAHEDRQATQGAVVRRRLRRSAGEAEVRERQDANALIFPGLKRGEPMSDMTLGAVLKRMGRADLTVHGMRSSFRDWAAEATDAANHVVEQALAHVIGNSVEAAYRRGDLFEKRRALMNDWAKFCGAAT